jgi:hypothetical protein
MIWILNKEAYCKFLFVKACDKHFQRTKFDQELVYADQLCDNF